MTDIETRTAKIRELNDLFRSTFLTGQVLLTPGIAGLPAETKSKVIEAVQSFTDFTPDNDPHGEHDFGAVTVDQNKVFWKIDYYNRTLDGGSEDPANPDFTARVLTIMLAMEY